MKAVRFTIKNTRFSIPILLIPVLLLCGCFGALVAGATIDSSLRGAGILPTNTLTPSATATATHTPTPAPPPTRTPTATATATPSPTAGPSPTPSATYTPAPTPTTKPSATPAPPTPTATPRTYIAPGAWRCAESLTGARYVGSSTMTFHDVNCRHVKDIAPHNRICFETREAAINAGYRPCGSCRP